MAHRNQASLRTLLAALAAASTLVGCYETSPPPVCTTEFAPVCGDDGVTYPNTCAADTAGVDIAHVGPCRTGNTCSVDGDCDIGALCQVPRCGAPVPAPDCEPDSGCPVPPRCDPSGGICELCACAEIYAPVCGIDGITYGNECEARCAHADIASSGVCGAECRSLACPPIWCEYGYVLDADGCSTCECNPAPVCPPLCDLYCPYGNVINADGCETCECLPEPICPEVLCAVDCEYGYATDARGCSTCTCNPPPVCEPVTCDLHCEFGFATDARGCETCSCNPPTDLCATDSECGSGRYCDFSMPTCAADACAPDEPCPPSICYGSCREATVCAPVACALACEFGFRRGADGCEICACNEPPPPPPPVRLCLDSASCTPGEYCDHSVCFTAPCPPGMACPAVCYGACSGAIDGGGGTPR